MFPLKRKLADPTARLTMQLCTIPSPVVTKAIAAAGADCVVVDMEHGAVDHASAHAMIAATQGADCAALVRVPRIDEADVKRVLDLGAEGIVFALVRTAADAARAVASLRYPPEGSRGFGPFIAHSCLGVPLPDDQAAVGENLVCCLLAETREAVENIEAICEVSGIGLIIPAQFDLSVDLGMPGQFDYPDFVAAVEKIEAAAHRRAISLGNIAFDRARAEVLLAKGYRVIGGFDVLWPKTGVAQAQSWTRP